VTNTSNTPRRLQRAGSSLLSGYRFLVTDAEGPTKEAKAAQRRQGAAEKAAADAIADRNAAIVKMAAAGMSPLAIARELTYDDFTMSATNVRMILKVHRGPAAKDGSKA